MEDNKKLLLLHKAMKSIALNERVDVMLTPQFYTLKKEKLPLRFTFQAKKIAASVFDGMLEEDRTYDYFVFQEGEAWVFIAYSLDEITGFLKSKGISLDNISKLFFAEQALHDFAKPYLLNEKEALTVFNDTVVVIPSSAIDSEKFITISDIQKPSKSISIHSAYASVLSIRQSFTLAVLFILFAVLFIVEGMRYGGDAEAGTQELVKLIESHPSLESQYKRESIAAKYRKIDSIEREKRDLIKTLGGLTRSGAELQLLRLDDKGFTADYSVKSDTIMKRLESEARNAKLSVTKSVGGLKIEGRL